MSSLDPVRRSLALGRRGIALPVALLALVVISLLVTTALLSSASESAVAGAHQDAADGLYDADAALKAYVAGRLNVAGTVSTRFADGTTNYVYDGTTYQVQVSEMRDSLNASGVQTTLDRTFALVASPGSGLGRSVGLMLQTRQASTTFTTNVNAGATSGGDINVSGNATISDGSNNTNCSLAKADYALQATAGSTISTGGSSNITGTTNITSYDKNQLVRQLLNGLSPDSMAQYADIKIGPRFGTPAFTSTNIDDSPTRAKSYNWGCPSGMGITCRGPASDTSFVPIIAIDAQGGTIGITGDFGQGMLLVVNGSLNITGDFAFKGLIIVDSDFSIKGTGGDQGKIQGAVLALGRASTQTDQYLGNAMITYNRCSVNAATNALNSKSIEGANQLLLSANRTWFEVVH